MEKTISKLISVGYPKNRTTITAKKLSQIDASQNDALAAWLENNIETDMPVGGFTLSELKAKHKMFYPTALLTMDWLIKEPKVATIAITRGIK